jgi:hypothetical protein
VRNGTLLGSYATCKSQPTGYCSDITTLCTTFCECCHLATVAAVGEQDTSVEDRGQHDGRPEPRCQQTQAAADCTGGATYHTTPQQSTSLPPAPPTSSNTRVSMGGGTNISCQCASMSIVVPLCWSVCWSLSQCVDKCAGVLINVTLFWSAPGLPDEATLYLT